MAKRVMNFGAGPSALPLKVLEQVAAEWLDFGGSGMSIVEVSHRSTEYDAVHEDTKKRLKRIAGFGDDYEVLFCTGGATTQFSMVALNLLGPGKFAEYFVTGSWAKKAYKEAKNYGDVRVAASAEAEDKSFTHIPKPAVWKLSDGATYVHLTSNNTIYGTQWHDFPKNIKAPLVADMSSDFLWRKCDLSPFSLIYAGAQKNLGPAGVTAVLIKKSLLEACRTDLPSMSSYRVFAENNSLFNTPPCFAIYMMNKVLAWIEDIGGLDAVEKMNRQKAGAVYGAIDSNPDFFRCPVAKEDRSFMNVVFRLPSEELEKKFLQAAKAAQMIGLKGHRSVGGMRASLYNGVPVEWARALADLMTDFAKKNG